MKPLIILWKIVFLNPNPFSPVHNALKFSAVFGTTSLKSSNKILCVCPAILTSKKTLGLPYSMIFYGESAFLGSLFETDFELLDLDFDFESELLELDLDLEEELLDFLSLLFRLSFLSLVSLRSLRSFLHSLAQWPVSWQL